MTEKSILFTAPMALAAREGRKTQTRRIIQLPSWADGGLMIAAPLSVSIGRRPYAVHKATGAYLRISPRYQPGDILLVGEPWRTLVEFDHLKPSELPAEATRSHILYEASTIPGAEWGHYRNARFLPFRFRRTRLEVLSVRVERVQDISEADAEAEGAMPCPPSYEGECLVPDLLRPYACGFARLWESIHGPGAWDRNDWVWRIEFRKVTA